ncbi:hypothetical protein [Streptomyces sporangiiformans]|nr:hypothetical protein [Streptomyces sporangiiformans]
MSAFSSDLGLSVLSPDDAEQVAQALQRAAQQGRRIAADTRH